MNHLPPSGRYPLTLTEAARAIGCSRSRAYEMAKSGALPTHRDQLGRLRVDPAVLAPALAAQQAETAAQPDLFTTSAPFTQRWLEAVLAAPDIDQETAEVARWLVSQADDQGRLSPHAQAVLQQAEAT